MLNRESPFNSCDEPLSTCVDGVLFDLDGVVYRGKRAVEHAVEEINALQVPHGYVTNNASRPPSDVAAHLTELGINATEEEITAWEGEHPAPKKPEPTPTVEELQAKITALTTSNQMLEDCLVEMAAVVYA